MTDDIETRRVQLNYPVERIDEPILYRLIVDYDLVPDIRRANIDPRSGGFIVLQLSGAPEALNRGLEWLKQAGIMVGKPGVDGEEPWTG